MPKKRQAKSKTAQTVETHGLSPFEIRDLLRRRLQAEGRDDLALHLEKCAELMGMSCVCCGKSFTIERGCKRRWCPVCAPRVTAARMMRLESVVARFKWPLAVTLTRQNVENADECVAAMKDAFRKFRRTDFWADRVRGGVAGFEVTHRGRGWHPHIHALVDCEWLAVETPAPRRGMSKNQVSQLCKRAQNELAEVWGAYVQGFKASVWVNRAWGNSMMETLKYAIKPSELLQSHMPASTIIDIIDQGRMITSFGVAHAASKEFVGRELPEERLPECEGCGGYKTVIPSDIREMYMDRPDLATRRFHRLMSLAGALHDDRRVWDAAKTIPDVVPKGHRPSPIRAIIAKE